MEVSGCYLLSILALVAVQDVLSAQGVSHCPQPLLVNGLALLKSRGRIVRYKCIRMFRAVGPMYATCINGAWDAEPPVCARPGCPPFRDPENGNREFSLRNSVAFISCNGGFYLNGSHTLFCDGRKWNGTLPQCIAMDTEPATFCDFDTMCGWSQDPSDDADWIQNSYAVPSRNLSTGPESDHTFGKGFGGRYMYASSQSPRKENDLTRLVSPVYPASLTADSSCFIFWYHMFGATMGSLRVYQKLANESLSVVEARWTMHGDKGDKWQQGMMSLLTVAAPFQIVMEAVRGRDVQSVIAIDDVTLEFGANCSLGVTVSSVDDSSSCEWRCNEDPANGDCACSSDCESRGNCCVDYTHFCTNASNQVNTTTVTLLNNSTTQTTSTTPLSVPTTPVPTTASTVVTTMTPTTLKTIATTQKPTPKTQKPIPTTQKPTTTKPTPTTTKPTPTTTKPTPTTTKPTTQKTTPATRRPIPTTRQPTTITRIFTRLTSRVTLSPPTQPRTTSTTTLRPMRTTRRFTRPSPTTASTAMLTAKSTPAAVAGEDEPEPTSMALVVLSAVAVCASLLLVSVVVVVLVRRYRLRARARELDGEDSDVRFLTASDGEIQLDFTLATPHL